MRWETEGPGLPSVRVEGVDRIGAVTCNPDPVRAPVEAQGVGEGVRIRQSEFLFAAVACVVPQNQTVTRQRYPQIVLIIDVHPMRAAIGALHRPTLALLILRVDEPNLIVVVVREPYPALTVQRRSVLPTRIRPGKRDGDD